MNFQDKELMFETYQRYVKLLSESETQNQEIYQDYAKVFDNMMDTGYRTPEILSKMCAKHMNINSTEALLLDVASGTGRLGQELKTLGYEGIIDGIEASSEMIKECMKKMIYRDVKQHFLSEKYPMPYPDNTYDIVVCAGAVILGHVPPQCLDDMIRILKPGGILLFNITQLDCDKDNLVASSTQKLMNRMVLENRCKLIEEISEPSYQEDEIAFYYCYNK